MSHHAVILVMLRRYRRHKVRAGNRARTRAKARARVRAGVRARIRARVRPSLEHVFL